MKIEKLTLRQIISQAVVLKLERPIVAKIATIEDWPLILIDLHTDAAGDIGRLKKSAIILLTAAV